MPSRGLLDGWRQVRQFAGYDRRQRGSAGHRPGLVAVRDWTFLLGSGLMPVFNALRFGRLLYRSRLVPHDPHRRPDRRPAPAGTNPCDLLGPEHATVLIVVDRPTLPIAAWELSVGLGMLIEGFNPTRTPS
jgi:hypothetical protein